MMEYVAGTLQCAANTTYEIGKEIVKDYAVGAAIGGGVTAVAYGGYRLYKWSRYADRAEDALEYIYASRIARRAVEDTGPMHNFPFLLDSTIMKSGKKDIFDDGYVQFSMPGYINNTKGKYEIGLKYTSNNKYGVITHRFFRPDKK